MIALYRHLLGALLLSALCAVHAYEPETHAAITAAAVGASKLAQDSELLKDLGVESTQQFPNGRGRRLTVPALLQDGARFEDDIPRPANHFYDPVNDRGITGFSKSPDWAVDGAGDASTTKFSFRAAREYMFAALTDRVTTFRQEQFGLMFRSLGQVIHHIQDMAQPQHTRHDLHCDIFLCRIIGQHAPSLYESYTDAEQIRRALNFSGYGPVYGDQDTRTFNSPKLFWHTTDGKGMADYSNRGFVSAGTNFDKPGLYPSPIFDAANAQHRDISEVCALEALAGRPCPNTNLVGEITFYGTQVEDNLRPSASGFNPRTSSYSIFDPDLTKAGRTPVFSLNRFNFYAAHDLLMPRAVGYSAGLINYFFRGKIDLKKDDQGNLRIANLGREKMSGRFALYYDAKDGNRYPVAVVPQSPGSDPQDAEAWQFTIDSPDAPQPSTNLSAPIQFVMPLPPSDSSPFAAKVANEYMLVFRGNMGEEAADPGTGVIGAVAAKMVAAPYNSVLYLLGADASNQRIFLRADKTGTRVVAPEEFHPLRNVILDPFQRSLPKAYTHRQAKFKETAFGFSHETEAITTGQDIQFPFRIVTTGFVKNSATGAFEPFNSNGPAWKAKSPDPRIGEFLFRAVISDNNYRVGQLEYRRTWLDAEGNPQTVNGSVALPPQPADGMDYGGFPQGGLYISPDGLSVRGFGAVTDAVSASSFEMRITLGEVPAISFASTGTVRVNIQSSQNTPQTTTVVGQVSISDNCPAPVTVTSDVVHTEFSVRFDEQFSELLNIGWVNGAFRTYFHTQNTLRRFSSTVTGGTAASCNLVHAESRGEQVNKLQVDGGWQFNVGNFPTMIRSNEAEFSPLPNQRWDYFYEGPLPSPPINFISTAFTPPINTNDSVDMALTERAEDAIYQRGLLNGLPNVMFRDKVIGTEAFVADASPIGEVFVATANLSIVVHEPKQGPTVALPPNVVKLLAVVWM